MLAIIIGMNANNDTCDHLIITEYALISRTDNKTKVAHLNAHGF